MWDRRRLGGNNVYLQCPKIKYNKRDVRVCLKNKCKHLAKYGEKYECVKDYRKDQGKEGKK